MKLSLFHKPAFVLLLIAVFFSCKNEDRKSVSLLRQAQSVIDDKPEQAIELIASIDKPNDMDEDNYMQYIVAQVQAKSKNKQDITNDTLITEAASYFIEKGDHKQAALANFYAGAISYKMRLTDKAMEYYLETESRAKLIGDNLLIGKSLNNMGVISFDENMLDSSIVYNWRALHYYDKSQNADPFKVYALNTLGRAYESKGNNDSAYYYFDKGFELATRTANIEYQGIFYNQLGVVLMNKAQYEKVAEYFHKSLELKPDTQDSLMTINNLARLYNTQMQLDSAKYYIDILKQRAPQIIYLPTMRNSYAAIAEYEKLSGNMDGYFQYNDSVKMAIQRIADSKVTDKLMCVQHQYRLDLKERELAHLKKYSYLMAAAGILFMLLICSLGYYQYQRQKRNNKLLATRNELLNAQNELLDTRVENLSFLQGIYTNILGEWSIINKEIDALAQEYGAKNKPEIFQRIERLVNNLKTNTDKELVDWAKDLLSKQPQYQEVINKLNNKDLILMMFCQLKYTKQEMADVLRISVQKVHPAKLALKHKLKEEGINELEINQLLFSTDEG